MFVYLYYKFTTEFLVKRWQCPQCYHLKLCEMKSTRSMRHFGTSKRSWLKPGHTRKKKGLLLFNYTYQHSTIIYSMQCLGKHPYLRHKFMPTRNLATSIVQSMGGACDGEPSGCLLPPSGFICNLFCLKLLQEFYVLFYCSDCLFDTAPISRLQIMLSFAYG